MPNETSGYRNLNVGKWITDCVRSTVELESPKIDEFYLWAENSNLVIASQGSSRQTPKDCISECG